MMRKEYIAGLEEIRKRMIEIGQAFASVDLTDATGMECDLVSRLEQEGLA